MSSVLKSLAVISCFIAIILGLLAISLAQIDYSLGTTFGWLAAAFISISVIAAAIAFFISFNNEIESVISSSFSRLLSFCKR